MPTLQALASQMSDAFETRTRDNGDKFVVLKDGSPEWMTDVCHEAHGDMLPDDYRYSFIRESVDAIAENDDLDDARQQVEEPDVYTAGLTDWLGSRVDRFCYCDDAMEEFGDGSFPGTVELLQWGQSRERGEVFDAVVSALEALATEDEEAEITEATE